MIPDFSYDPAMGCTGLRADFGQHTLQNLLQLCTSVNVGMLICGDAGTTKTATISNFIQARLAAEPDRIKAKTSTSLPNHTQPLPTDG